MADAPRTDTPAAPPGARTRRILIVLGILVVAISAVGFLAGGRLSCAVGIALADCPAAGADLAAPVGPEEPAVPGQFELRLSSGVELDTDPPSVVTAGAPGTCSTTTVETPAVRSTPLIIRWPPGRARARQTRRAAWTRSSRRVC